jgi:hypothetical protein
MIGIRSPFWFRSPFGMMSSPVEPITAPQEVWPPTATPDFYFDFDLGEGYWGGSAKTLSDFIDDGSGSYRVSFGDLGLTGTEDYAMMMEFYNDDTEFSASDTDMVLAFKRASNKFAYMRAQQPPITENGWDVNGRFSYTDPTRSRDAGHGNIATGSDNSIALGLQRVIGSRKLGEVAKAVSSQGGQFSLDPGVSTNTNLPDSDKSLYINQAADAYGVIASDPNTSGVQLKRVALWGRSLTDTEMWQTSRFGRPGILFSGDSFVAGGVLRQTLVGILDQRGLGPVATTYDGVGESSLTDHAIRYAALDPFLHGEYLIIMDGGFEISDGIQAAKDAIDSYLSNLTHDNWVFIEPNSIPALGTANRDIWDDFFYGASDNTGARELYNHIGADHYIKTYDTMLANGDGSPEDNARIAAGQWPYNVVNQDGIHMSDFGMELVMGLVADYMQAKKWV